MAAEDRKFVVYGDIFFGHYFDKEAVCNQMIRDHTLVYIYSGELEIVENGETTVLGPGGCAFMRRDNRVQYTKQPVGEEAYAGIFMKFKRNVLREVFNSMDFSRIPHDAKRPKQSVYKIEQRPDIISLFHSMTPYFYSDIQPTEELMQLKVREAIHALLNINPGFYATLFDFTEAWKIDILEFLNSNFMYDLSMEEIASFTGRSLSTFKRDFQKISELSPQKWLIQKRLEAAREMLRDKDKSVTDVYMEVGFKNFSHFSRAFRQQYGVAPSEYN